MTIDDVTKLAETIFPNAAEIHVQCHMHRIIQRCQMHEGTENVCVCAVEGHDLRKQFTARSLVELASKISNGQADWEDWHRFENPAEKREDRLNDPGTFDAARMQVVQLDKTSAYEFRK